MATAQSEERRRVCVSVCLDTSLLARLDAAAKCEGSSRSRLMRRLLRQALEGRDEEDALWRLSDRRALLADYAPEDEGLYDDPRALGATRVQR